MPAMDRERSALLIVDFQSRLMPAIDGSPAVIANARRLARHRGGSAAPPGNRSDPL